MDSRVYMNAPTFERPEVPEWVKERRDQMPTVPQMQRIHWQPGMMPQPHTAPVASQAGHPANGTPTWASPELYYDHPYQNNGWGGSNWGPFDGMGDMFGNMDMDFSMSLRGSGSNHGYGRGYNGYGHGLNTWPTTLTPVETASIEAPPTVDVAAIEQTTAVDKSTVKTDGDADSIPDISDICPDSAAGAVVDSLGCEKSASIVLRGVNFKTNSDELTETSTEILDRVANTLIANPAVVVEIAGHTDSDADESYNKDLSQRRAETVMAYLTDKGAIASNMTAMGYGEEQPIASNETSEGKAQNRRVELNRNK
ncbi:MAG: OmpA family protein [Candidatus Thiodiazotropha sp. L084R]